MKKSKDEAFPNKHSGLCCTQIENFNVKIGKNEILKDINLHIHCGELTAIIGPNGAGKSTLLKAIIGDIKHTGSLFYAAEDGTHFGKPIIGYVPQYLTFDITTPTSVFDLFVACKSNYPTFIKTPKRFKDEIIKSLDKVSASSLIDKRIGSLSGGELQRVLLALALEPIPNILLLDEPVSGIDRNGLEVFYNVVSELRRKYDLTIILISHDFDLVAKYADRVILLNNTVVCNDTPQNVFNDEKMSEIFHSKFNMKGEK